LGKIFAKTGQNAEKPLFFNGFSCPVFVLKMGQCCKYLGQQALFPFFTSRKRLVCPKYLGQCPVFGALFCTKMGQNWGGFFVLTSLYQPMSSPMRIAGSGFTTVIFPQYFTAPEK
jgi:hypothetical protein